MVVDDNATNRRILRQQLLSWGVEAVEAADGYQALELAGAAARDGRAFDLGIIDLNMPGIDGLELARRLKARHCDGSTMLFLLSSSGYHSEAAESHLNGFAASLTKPVRSSDLFDCLVTSLDSGSTHKAKEVPVTAPFMTPEVSGMILLVEDNKVNQLVGSKVLQNLGYEFTIANNGIEAVASYRSGSYDAVLMDCQMPEMDGFEATGAIRSLEAFSDLGHVPIIAMTAAAMEGDRERCIAAGMDDFVTKPVRLEVVSAVLERWVTKKEFRPAVPRRSAAERGRRSVGPLPDSAAPEPRRRAGRGACRNRRRVPTLRSGGSAELERSLSAGDRGAFERTAHTLKGASANVGASGLADVCTSLETRARQAQLQDVAVLMEQFDTELARVRAALEAVMVRA